MKVPFTDLWKEFKAFAFKGNMLDLAVAVVIGAAFGEVIKAMVDFLLMPLLSYITPAKGGYEEWTLGKLKVGLFIGAIIKFLLVAAGVFIVIVKILGTLMKKTIAAPAAGPVIKECPLCISEIPIKATRCKFCTSEVRV
jgi:large conductance mechanosensitive channel